MHTRPMRESEGEFDHAWKPTAGDYPDYRCRCGSGDVWYRVWGSDCGGYEDTQYECRACRKRWWVDGPDA